MVCVVDNGAAATATGRNEEVLKELRCPHRKNHTGHAPEDVHIHHQPHAQLGDVIRIEVRTRDFGRIAAQTARQVIIQGMREAERGMIYDEFSSKEHEILTGVVTRVDPRNGNVSLRIGTGTDSTEALLMAGEQVPGEDLTEGMHVKVYVVEVRRSSRGPQVLISRTHPGLVKRLFELEVPEIYDGTVEVKSIAREAGERTKIAVKSNDPNIDPVGTCVGPRGSRVQNVVNELGGENIDIVQYEEDPSDYIANALNPAEVIAVQFEDEDDERKAFVIVPDYQLSLAIGKKGQNVRLAARLTGYKIDIRPESEVEFVDESEVEDETEVAEDQDLQQTAVEEADDQAEAEDAEDLDLDDEE